jgi:hypothetical protein
MQDEIVIFRISGFLPRAAFWFAVGSAFIGIDVDWFIHRQGESVLIWMPWTIGLAAVSAGPYFLCYRSLRRFFHYLWLGLKFDYGSGK